MAQKETVYLNIRRSTDLDHVWLRVPLTDAEIHLGRPEAGEPGVNLEYPRISRRHACVERQELEGTTVYILRNVAGRAGVRLYEHLLKPGDSHLLKHSYTFQIPGVLETTDAPHFLITLCIENGTTCLAIKPDQPPNISIFGQIVEFTEQEYALLAYLYERRNTICPYIEIIAALWAPEPQTQEQIKAYLEKLQADRDEYSIRKESLDSLLSRVRDEIRNASGGVVLIETIRGKGLCLRTSCLSDLCKDSPGLP